MTEAFLKTYFSAHPGARLKVFIKANNCYPCSTTVTVPVTSIAARRQAMTLINSSKTVTSKNALEISYQLEKQGVVTISLFNTKGALIKLLTNSAQNEGIHRSIFDVANLSCGFYYCKLKSGNTEYTVKFAIAR